MDDIKKKFDLVVSNILYLFTQYKPNNLIKTENTTSFIDNEYNEKYDDDDDDDDEEEDENYNGYENISSIKEYIINYNLYEEFGNKKRRKKKKKKKKKKAARRDSENVAAALAQGPSIVDSIPPTNPSVQKAASNLYRYYKKTDTESAEVKPATDNIFKVAFTQTGARFVWNNMPS
tara:strand:+ start:2798 stop:3325 length:528 start_codon:yes stop_codon:yes gene_type:complete